jgi:hypothetical protein
MAARCWPRESNPIVRLGLLAAARGQSLRCPCLRAALVRFARYAFEGPLCSDSDGRLGVDLRSFARAPLAIAFVIDRAVSASASEAQAR